MVSFLKPWKYVNRGNQGDTFWKEGNRGWRPLGRKIFLSSTVHLSSSQTLINIRESSGCLWKHRLLGCAPLQGVGLEWDLRICISDKFLGDADTATLGTTLWEPLVARHGALGNLNVLRPCWLFRLLSHLCPYRVGRHPQNLSLFWWLRYCHRTVLVFYSLVFSQPGVSNCPWSFLIVQS